MKLDKRIKRRLYREESTKKRAKASEFERELLSKKVLHNIFQVLVPKVLYHRRVLVLPILRINCSPLNINLHRTLLNSKLPEKLLTRPKL